MKNSFDEWQRSLRLIYLLKSITNGKKRLISYSGETSLSFPDKVRKLISPLYKRTLFNGTTASENNCSSLISAIGTTTENSSSNHNNKSGTSNNGNGSSTLTPAPIGTSLLPLENHFEAILTGLGYDVTSEDMKDTPRRYIKHMYESSHPAPFKFTKFRNRKSREMIVQRNITFYSSCSHHTLPFFGVIHIGYLPNEWYVGLSKLARTVQYCSSGLKTQEQITDSLMEFLNENLSPDVAIYVEATHLCMCMRGIRAHGATSSTQQFSGKFKTDSKLREEFMRLINKH